MSHRSEVVASETTQTGASVTHREAVEYLAQRLNAVAGGDTSLPRVVLLRGASGTGKTWVIRALYNRLREELADQYWPESHEDAFADRTGMETLTGRKKITPDPHSFEWPADELPTFGWWGFNCERLSTGGVRSMLNDAFSQIDAHVVPLRLRWQQEAGLKLKAEKAGKQALKELRGIAREEGPSAALSQFGIEIPFLSTLIGLGWGAGKSLQTTVKTRRDLKDSVDIGERLRSSAQQKSVDLASVFRELILPELPAVIAIEDVQLMSAEISALVDAVTKGGSGSTTAPVLVVGTVWPEAFSNSDSEFARWFAEADQDNRVEILDLQGMGEAELINIVKTRAPDTADDVAARIVQPPLDNPYFLKLWLAGKPIERALRNSRALRADIAQSLPQKASEVLEARWNELPEPVQDALMCAAVVNPLDQGLLEFVPKVIAEVLVELGDKYWQIKTPKEPEEPWDEGKAVGALKSAIDPVGWCRLEDSVQFFTESALADVARQRVVAENGFDSDELAEIRRVTRQRLAEWITDHAGEAALVGHESAARVIGSWYARLQADPATAANDAELSPERVMSFARQLAQWSDYTTATQLAEPILPELQESLGERSRAFIDVRWEFATWVGESGRYAQGETLLFQANKDAETWFPEEAAEARLKQTHSDGWLVDYAEVFSSDAYGSYVSWWQAAARHEATRAELAELKKGPAEGVSETQHAVAAIERELQAYEEVLLHGEVWDSEQDGDPVALATDALERLGELHLGHSHELVLQAHNILGESFNMMLSVLEYKRGLWGSGELVHPGMPSEIAPDDNSAETYYQRRSAEEDVGTYEFLVEHEPQAAHYRERALVHYRVLFEAAENTDDAKQLAELRPKIEELELGQDQNQN